MPASSSRNLRKRDIIHEFQCTCTVLQIAFKDDETLARIVHVTGNDRLGTTAIYLNLIDMHVVVNTFRSGRGSFSSRLGILD